jgi:predicted transcriptional regulator
MELNKTQVTLMKYLRKYPVKRYGYYIDKEATERRSDKRYPYTKEIAKATKISYQTTAKHLRILEQNKFIRKIKEKEKGDKGFQWYILRSIWIHDLKYKHRDALRFLIVLNHFYDNYKDPNGFVSITKLLYAVAKEMNIHIIGVVDRFNTYRHGGGTYSTFYTKGRWDFFVDEMKGDRERWFTEIVGRFSKINFKEARLKFREHI